MRVRGTVKDQELSIAGARVSTSRVRDLLGGRVPVAE